MPEGDTIHRSATALRAALIGKIMTGFEAPRLSGLTPARGSTIERVSSRGKHIEIGWDDGVVLHTHMRMTGSWHLYRPGERWRKSSKHMRAVIEVEGFEAVCFNAPVVETFRAGDVVVHPGQGGLGPDLTDEHVDLDECVGRIPRFCDESTTAAEMLLDQRIACGVGNVYKSEVLWACGVHPQTPVAALDIDTRAALIDTAASFLQADLEQPARVTLPGSADGVAVYGRYGKPCYRCGQPIEVRRYGEQTRVTYWCEGCQLRFDEMELDGVWTGRADAPTPVDLASAKARRRASGPVEPSGELARAVDHADVMPALERHPASQRLLSGFPPRGPEPSFVDPLLGRGHTSGYADEAPDVDGPDVDEARDVDEAPDADGPHVGPARDFG